MDEVLKWSKLALNWNLDQNPEMYEVVKQFLMQSLGEKMEQFDIVRSLGLADPNHPLNHIRSVRAVDHKTYRSLDIKLW